ncbi:MAG: type II secretion system protein H [Candidatus Kentron sp. G]|nr:MAG: type II secretion system protein H [Candidatus Kentron sp. G]VFN03451.1 MAG: type II secretion system protein H [Candidatus Kentron sp. G]
MHSIGGIGRKHAGLTLFELLVVIAIIGIASTMIVVSFDLDDPAKDTKTEAKRLVNLIRLAIDESIITGSDMGLEFTLNGYRFLHHEYGTKNWQVLKTTGVLRTRTLPETMTFKLISADNTTSPSAHGDRAPHPWIVFLPSGEITPFRLAVIDRDGGKEHRIIGRWDGSVILETDEHPSFPTRASGRALIE